MSYTLRAACSRVFAAYPAFALLSAAVIVFGAESGNAIMLGLGCGAMLGSGIMLGYRIRDGK